MKIDYFFFYVDRSMKLKLLEKLLVNGNRFPNSFSYSAVMLQSSITPSSESKNHESINPVNLYILGIATMLDLKTGHCSHLQGMSW